MWGKGLCLWPKPSALVSHTLSSSTVFREAFSKLWSGVEGGRKELLEYFTVSTNIVICHILSNDGHIHWNTTLIVPQSRMLAQLSSTSVHVVHLLKLHIGDVYFNYFFFLVFKWKYTCTISPFDFSPKPDKYNGTTHITRLVSI